MAALLKGWGSYAPSSLEWNINIIYLEFFCMGDLSPLPIYYYIHSFIILVWPRVYLFYTLGYYPMLLCIFAQIVPVLTTEDEQIF